MHTTKPFPHRPAVISRKNAPHPRLIPLAGNDSDMVAPDDDRPDPRGRAAKLACPLASDPQVAVIEPQVLHQPASAPRQPRVAWTPPTHPALPPLSLSEARIRSLRELDATSTGLVVGSLGVAVFTLMLLIGLHTVNGRPSRLAAAAHVAVDDGWCLGFTHAPSCEQKTDSK